MDDAEIIRMIRQTIREELAPILMGKVISTESPDRMTVQRYSNETPLDKLRNIQPYGLASRPPSDMTCLTIPIGGDPSHINVVGQFDSARPPIDGGEVCLYGPAGQQIWFGNDGMVRSGARGAANPAVLGDILQTMMQNILNAILNAPQIGISPVGPVMLDSSIRTALSQELSTRVNAPATNFLAQKHFVQRE